ncbi:hypothetical protein PYW08_016969 [Mythimna loreyi]|nr:hypothetical protein PYW08_016969 [Mythimna loreyi]
MFSMELLLYKIGCDKEPVLDIVKRALPLYDQMVREEVINRQMLQERGLSIVQELLSAREPQPSSSYRVRPQEECDYCRASLFLSKVKGLPAKNSVLCLEHTLMLLDTHKYKDTDVHQLQIVVHVSVKELHKVQDDMNRHLRKTRQEQTERLAILRANETPLQTQLRLEE